MAFSSIPVYLDPPNWQQQINQQQGDVRENHQLLPSLPPPSSAAAGGSGLGSIRPCSMSERAKLEKIPQPEPGLKCPRCDSTNTKFCYFNNYSLSQPRHFCKTCRRYWTRGGALRNVPVGGGCRRNKRSKRSRSKSPAIALERQSAGSNSAVSSTDIMGHFPHPPPELRFLPSLHQLTNFPSGDGGLNFGEIQTSMAARGCSTDMEFQIGNNPSVAGPIMSARLTEQLRLQQVQQFPYFTGLEPSGADIYQLENESIEPSNYVEGAMSHEPGASKPMESGVTHLSTVKPEENVQGFNLSRSFLGIPGNDQYWGGNAWTDLSGLNSSSSGNLL